MNKLQLIHEIDVLAQAYCGRKKRCLTKKTKAELLEMVDRLQRVVILKMQADALLVENVDTIPTASTLYYRNSIDCPAWYFEYVKLIREAEALWRA